MAGGCQGIIGKREISMRKISDKPYLNGMGHLSYIGNKGDKKAVEYLRKCLMDQESTKRKTRKRVY